MEKFEGCYFTTRPRNGNAPTRRWGHTAVVMQGQMFLFGGYTGVSETTVLEPLYKMDVETGSYERIFAEKTPDNRDSHTCVVFDNQMFFWGGCINGEIQVRGDMFCFEGGIWKKIQQQGQIPPPRESHQAVGLSNRWIILFGGYNGKTKCQDCYIFDRLSCRWFALPEVARTLEYRQAASACVIQGLIYIFGGQDKRSKLTNTLYKLKIDVSRKSKSGKEPYFEVQAVETKGEKPLQRCSHNSTSYQDRYIIIVGGQTEQPNKRNKVLGLNDIWLFDTFTSIWCQLRPYNQNLFLKRSTFSLCIANDTLIIFGGMDPQNSDDIYGDTVYLHLTKKLQNGVIKICQICEQPSTIGCNQMELEEQEQGDPLLMVDISNLGSLASTNHPFQSIGILISNIVLQGCRRLQINLKQHDQQIVMHLSYDLKESCLPSWKLSQDLDLVGLLHGLSNNILMVDNYKDNSRVTLLIDGRVYRVMLNKDGEAGTEDRLMMKYIRPFLKEVSLSSFQHSIIVKMDEQSLDHFVVDTQENEMAQNFNLLSNYLRHLFLQQPKQLQFYIGNELIKFGTMDHRSYERLELPKELSKGDIYYVPDCHNVVLVYNKNVLVGVLNNIGRGRYAGYLSMSQDFVKLGWRLSKLEEALEWVVSQHDCLQGKRRPATTIEHLDEECKISMLSL